MIFCPCCPEAGLQLIFRVKCAMEIFWNQQLFHKTTRPWNSFLFNANRPLFNAASSGFCHCDCSIYKYLYHAAGAADPFRWVWHQWIDRFFYRICRNLRHCTCESAVWQTGGSLFNQTHHTDRRQRYCGCRSSLCRYKKFLAPDWRPFFPRTIYPRADNMPSGLSGKKSASWTIERCHGFLCICNGCRWFKRSLARRLDSSAASLALCFRECVNSSTDSDDCSCNRVAGRNGSKKDRRKRIGFYSVAVTSWSVRRILCIFINFQLPAVLPLRPPIQCHHPDDHPFVPCLYHRDYYQPASRQVFQ